MDINIKNKHSITKPIQILPRMQKITENLKTRLSMGQYNLFLEDFSCQVSLNYFNKTKAILAVICFLK